MSFAKLLKRPILTEKTSILMDRSNKFVFEVSANATKDAIAQAIKEVYGVSAVKVNVLKSGSKTKRSWSGKRSQFTKSEFKKAIVTLKDNESINLYKEEKK
jgi:large subunit ribosomal protein L23